MFVALKATCVWDIILVDDGTSNRKLTVRLVEQPGADTLAHGHFGEDQRDMTIRLLKNGCNNETA